MNLPDLVTAHRPPGTDGSRHLLVRRPLGTLALPRPCETRSAR